MTKRSRTICVILAIILTILLEVATIGVMKYNVFTLIVSAILYFATFIFAVFDGYCTLKKGFDKYFFFMTIRDVGLLEVQLTIWYFIGNIRGIQLLEAIIVVALMAVFFYIAIKFGKLATKNCTQTYTEY